MLTLLTLACAFQYDEASNLCGEIDRPIGSPQPEMVQVITVLDGETACRNTDTGGPGWWGDVVASPEIEDDHFQATVDPGTYGVEVYTNSDYSGCAEAVVADTTTCSADIVVQLAEHVSVDKPNVYLYPTEPTDIAVRIPAWRRITESDPRYPVDGWRVKASPDGRLDTQAGPRDYLFYEMNVDTSRFQAERGWCVPGALAQASVEAAMGEMGFLPNEIADFATAWDGAFPEAAVMTVYPQVDGLARLTVDPAPDTLLRAWFLVADGCQAVEPFLFEPVDRVGYHAAEWGIAFAAPLERPEIMVFGG